jgi:hypothetical protein
VPFGTTLIRFFSFVLGALQIAENNDPLTRVFAFVAFAALAFSLMVNQLLPYHMNNIYTMDVHYAYHLLEVNFSLSNSESGR